MSTSPSPEPAREPRLDPTDRAVLLDAAEDAIGAALQRVAWSGSTNGQASPAVRATRSSFVTLRRNGYLLGCIGSLEPRQALVDDVAANAVAAAFRDPRLPAVTRDDFEQMEVKVSVLGDLFPLPAPDYEALRRHVVPGEDGLVISSVEGRATFLPSVWEQLPDVDEFLAALWHKAGLRPGHWPRDLVVQRYRTVEFGRSGPRRLGEHPAQSA